MKKDNKMIVAVILLSCIFFFIFSQDAADKISLGGILLLAASGIGIQVYLLLKKKPWPDRRFGLLCGGMVLAVALLIWCAGRIKSHWEEYSGLFYVESILIFILVLVWCGLCIWMEKGVTENLVLLILFGAFLIRVFYAVLIQSHIFQNDLGSLEDGDYGHMGYVYYLYAYGRLPDVNPMEYYQFYQPPLHHAICALLIRIFVAVGYEIGETQELLQILTVMYGALTLFFLNKIGIRLKISPFGRGIGLAFASFLPFGIMLGGSLNNDNLMTLLAVMALYYALVWYEEPGYKSIAAMALCIGCSMMAKLSGVLVAPAMAFLMLWKAWKERVRWKDWLKQFLFFGILAFPLGLWYSVLRSIQFGMPLGFVPALLDEVEQYIGMHETWSRFFDFKNAFDSLALGWNNVEWADYNIPISMVKCGVLGEGYNYHANPALQMAAEGVFWATFVLAPLVVAGFVLWLFQRKNSFVEKVFIGAAIVVVMCFFFKFCLDYPFVCTMNIRYVMVAVYLAFLIFGAAAGELVRKMGGKMALAAKAAKIAIAGFAECYMAGAVVLIVQLCQIVP